jgi:hypothetical protein
MKKLFIFILSFPLLTSFGQSTNSFCSFNQNGEKYELNLVDGTGSVTWVKYNRSGDILNSGRGTWSMSNDAVYGGLYERLTVNIPTGQMKFLVVRTSRGAIQELQDESAYKRNFQPCTGILSGGSNQTQKIIQYNPNASMIIGTPITIGTLMIASKDMPEPLDWWEAKEECLRLGDGWRLPTKEELDLIYENKSRIGVFKNGGYWSISQSANRITNDGVLILAWTKNFKTGIKTDYEKKEIGYVRAVKTGVANSEVKEPIKEPAKLPVKINIIGTPIKIFNFEVAENDFPGGEKMTWEEAKKACESLGDGWRLPTKEELNILYLNKKNFNGIVDNSYWSSTKIGNFVDIVSFIDGRSSSAGSSYGWVVRAIRTIKRGDSAKESIFSTSDKQIVIGTTIKIRNLEVAQFDFAQKMNWDLAKVACDALGDGWRLPTKDELKILYRNKSNVWGSERVFKAIWSSTEYGASLDGAWYQYMSNDSPSYKGKTQTGDVRAVRSFK